jgi:hypothetical protein
MFDATGGQYRETIIYVEAAKQIAWKKSGIDSLDATGIPAAFQISWQKDFISPALESDTNKLFSSAADTESEPW